MSVLFRYLAKKMFSTYYSIGFDTLMLNQWANFHYEHISSVLIVKWFIKYSGKQIFVNKITPRTANFYWMSDPKKYKRCLLGDDSNVVGVNIIVQNEELQEYIRAFATGKSKNSDVQFISPIQMNHMFQKYY